MATARDQLLSSSDDRLAEVFGQLNETQDPSQRQTLCDEIITLTVPIADRIALRFRNRGIATDDLRQVARTALVAATRRFEGSSEAEFVGYVVPCIRGEIKRHFRDAGWMIRPPRSIQEAQQRVARAREDLLTKLGREPDEAELAGETGLEPHLVAAAARAQNCFSPERLDAPTAHESDTGTRSDFLGDLDPGFDQAEVRALLNPHLKRLTPRDRQLLALRFFRGLTQKEVGERIGISQMQVSREESKILGRLRKALGGRSSVAA
jgi:RNA polymerase sigma-B factor